MAFYGPHCNHWINFKRWGRGEGDGRQRESLIPETEQTLVSTASILGCLGMMRGVMTDWAVDGERDGLARWGDKTRGFEVWGTSVRANRPRRQDCQQPGWAVTTTEHISNAICGQYGNINRCHATAASCTSQCLRSKTWRGKFFFFSFGFYYLLSLRSGQMLPYACKIETRLWFQYRTDNPPFLACQVGCGAQRKGWRDLKENWCLSAERHNTNEVSRGTKWATT